MANSKAAKLQAVPPEGTPDAAPSKPGKRKLVVLLAVIAALLLPLAFKAGNVMGVARHDELQTWTRPDQQNMEDG